MGDVEEVKKVLDKLEMHDGITFSGGDPMFQAGACAEIAKHAKKLKLNVMFVILHYDFTLLFTLHLAPANFYIDALLQTNNQY